MFHAAKKTTYCAFGLLMAMLSLVIVPGSEGVPREAPVFTCRAPAGMECGYVINGLHGSANFVLGSAESRTLDEKFIGDPYCVTWGRPRVPMPAWPQCLVAPIGRGQSHGVVTPGRSNG